MQRNVIRTCAQCPAPCGSSPNVDVQPHKRGPSPQFARLCFRSLRVCTSVPLTFPGLYGGKRTERLVPGLGGAWKPSKAPAPPEPRPAQFPGSLPTGPAEPSREDHTPEPCPGYGGGNARGPAPSGAHAGAPPLRGTLAGSASRGQDGSSGGPAARPGPALPRAAVPVTALHRVGRW